MVQHLESVSSFDNWFPVRIVPGDDAPRVWWFRRGTIRFDERFFHESVARVAKRPFNLAFPRETSIELFGKIAETGASLPVKGLIFHLSRCGSTLVSNAFGLRSDTLVLSEPGPVNDVLSLQGSADERVRWLRSCVAVLARKQRAEQTGCVIKLDAWHTRSLSLFHAAFPSVPWVFLYRDPLEVLISHLNTPSFMMSAANAPAALGMPVTDAARVPRDEYCAMVLAEILRSVQGHTPERSHIVAYSDLPEAIWTRIGPAFGLAFSEAAVARVRESGAYHAKDPQRAFVPDTQAKQDAACRLSDTVTALLRSAKTWYEGPGAQ